MDSVDAALGACCLMFRSCLWARSRAMFIRAFTCKASVRKVWQWVHTCHSSAAWIATSSMHPFMPCAEVLAQAVVKSMALPPRSGTLRRPVPASPTLFSTLSAPTPSPAAACAPGSG